jgi:hypothetical protein
VEVLHILYPNPKFMQVKGQNSIKKSRERAKGKKPFLCSHALSTSWLAAAVDVISWQIALLPGFLHGFL